MSEVADDVDCEGVVDVARLMVVEVDCDDDICDAESDD